MSIAPRTNFDFLGKRHVAYVLSLALVVGSLYLWFSLGESKYGVDFKGGHEIVVAVADGVGSDDLRKALDAAGFKEAVVQSFEFGSNEYAIRISGGGSSQEVAAKREAVTQAVKQASPALLEIKKADYVGAVVGGELLRKGMIALAIGLVAILCYITYRFEFSFALGAVVALFHDVIIASGGYLLAGHQVNMSFVAAALTIVGYSVNDTIVIFDRVREEALKNDRKLEMVPLINYCLNATLGRTIITSLLTLFSAAALLIFGGGAISDLSLYLVIGIVAGSYSTMFIAAPIVIAWENYQIRREARRKSQNLGAEAKGQA